WICRFPADRAVADRCPECGNRYDHDGVYAAGRGPGAAPSRRRMLMAWSLLVASTAAGLAVLLADRLRSGVPYTGEYRLTLRALSLDENGRYRRPPVDPEGPAATISWTGHGIRGRADQPGLIEFTIIGPCGPWGASVTLPGRLLRSCSVPGRQIGKPLDEQTLEALYAAAGFDASTSPGRRLLDDLVRTLLPDGFMHTRLDYRWEVQGGLADIRYQPAVYWPDSWRVRVNAFWWTFAALSAITLLAPICPLARRYDRLRAADAAKAGPLRRPPISGQTDRENA
ncbi:MAG: hypothetical protein K2X91_02705, partial [Thermoleophilia bacterium]|nr:hypothetical protein [Thermoleophilia bacterium]